MDGPAGYPDVQQVPRRLIYASNEQSVNAVARSAPSLIAACARVR